MNDTAAAASNLSGVLAAASYGTLTGIQLAVIAVFALIVLIAIAYGVRMKRRRKAAERTVDEHAAAAGICPAPATPAEPSRPADRPHAVAAKPESAQPASIQPETPEPETRPIADEPIAAAAPLTASPAAEAASPPTSTPTAADSSVTLLKGLGPKVATRLAELGITTVGQIAALTDDQANALDADLGQFRGRLARDRWVEQARFLAAGDRAGFEAVFGKL